MSLIITTPVTTVFDDVEPGGLFTTQDRRKAVFLKLSKPAVLDGGAVRPAVWVHDPNRQDPADGTLCVFSPGTPVIPLDKEIA